MELRVMFGDLLSREILCPSRVVEQLRHCFSWRFSSLEFNDHERALHVDCEHIDKLPAGGRDLAFDQQETFPDKREIARESVLELTFCFERLKPNWFQLRSQLPKSDFNWH